MIHRLFRRAAIGTGFRLFGNLTSSGPWVRRRGGFTLVELLVTIVIISILAGVVLGALAAARESAKHSATRATIGKLHGQMMLHWETFRTRKLPLYITTNDNRSRYAARQLVARWDMARMELPDQYDDLNFTPLTYPTALFDNSPPDQLFRNRMSNNALRVAYKSRLANYPGTASDANSSAEMLYLTLVAGVNPDDQVQFLASETGDTDLDGNREFLDGWGQPIRWIRWAPGYIPWSRWVSGYPSELDGVTDLQSPDPINRPDGFDPLGVGRPGSGLTVGPPTAQPTGMTDRFGFNLVPLIYSAGPDGEYGISGGGAAPDPSVDWNPYSAYGGRWRGTPVPGLEGGGHLDNITNHQLSIR